MTAPPGTSSIYFLLIACSVCVAQSSKSAGVTVEVWTQAEEQIHDASIALVEVGTEKNIGNFRNGRAEGIPFGQYTLHVRRSGFKWFERKIEIEDSDIFVRAVLSVANLPSKSSTLKGRLASKGTVDWIKLLPILDSTGCILEGKVQDNGTFFIGGIENGEYVLVALRGLRAVSIMRLHIQGDTELEPLVIAK